MKYLMLVCVDPDLPDEEAPGSPDIEEWVRDTDAKGIRLIGNRTRPGSDATTVRVRNGEVLLTDGPYAETKDLIAGFDVLECADLDEAVEVAARHTMAWNGVIELRPFWVDGDDD
ncbi:YciI family protein [Catenulispora yoronensis]|uniref:YciI family protein n=1 Tax=Catenulispora yoronensis TaxID=450799 RepID=A0ABP5FTW8_9ACTN